MAKGKEIKRWITVNGRHVPIYDGESVEEAIKKVTNSNKSVTPEKEDDNYFQRSRDSRNKEERDKVERARKVVEDAAKQIDKHNGNDNEMKNLQHDDEKEAKEFFDKIKKERAAEKEDDRAYNEGKNAWHPETEEERAEYERRRDSAKSLGLPADTLGQLATDNFNEAGVKKAVDRGWISQEQADKINGKSSNVTTINDRLAEDAAKFKENPNVAAREGWGDGYYQEVKEYINSQKTGQESGNSKNREYFEQAKKEGRIDKDAEYEDFVSYAPIKDDSNYEKKRIAREIADENDAYDREHGEGRYAEKAEDNLYGTSKAAKQARRELYIKNHPNEFDDNGNYVGDKKESAGGSFEAELEEYSDPEYKNVTKGVKTEKQAGKYATPEQKERVENAKDLIKHYMDQGKSLEEAKELAYRVKSDKSIKIGNKEVGVKKEAEEVVDFGNGHLKQQQITYKGIKMTRAESNKIDKVFDDLSFLSERKATHGYLSDADQKKREELENELRRYKKKYPKLPVGWYLPGGK